MSLIISEPRPHSHAKEERDEEQVGRNWQEVEEEELGKVFGGGEDRTGGDDDSAVDDWIILGNDL